MRAFNSLCRSTCITLPVDVEVTCLQYILINIDNGKYFLKVFLRLAYLTMYVCSAMGPAAMFGTSVPKSLFLCRFFGCASKFLKVNCFTVIMFRGCRMACSGDGIHLNTFIRFCVSVFRIQIFSLHWKFLTF